MSHGNQFENTFFVYVNLKKIHGSPKNAKHSIARCITFILLPELSENPLILHSVIVRYKLTIHSLLFNEGNVKPEDSVFVDQVAEALFKVREANVIMASQSISFGDEQPVEASVVIDREAIRNRTGREKVRDVVIDDIHERLERMHGLEVTRTSDDKLIVKTVPMCCESDFGSVGKLLDGASRAEKFLADNNADDE